MKNRLSDLNNHLFTAIERLSSENLTLEEIDREVKRSKAIVAVSDQIITNAALKLEAVKLVAVHGAHFKRELPMIEDKSP